VPIEAICGDTEEYDVTVTSEGKALNLVDVLVKFYILDGNRTILTKSSENIEEIDLYNPSGGQFKLYLTSGDTLIKPGCYMYEIELTFPNGLKRTINRDFIFVKECV